ncbi:MAG: hypothetical protein U5K79_17060 [Cyclobacteriaceae bacterium]|nr:hypothetical protein [Cyclobacteriaceae bacterium]
MAYHSIIYRLIFPCIALFWTFNGLSQDLRLGAIHFKATGAEVAQPYFTKGMLLLHNMEYDAARQEFEMAQLLDPDMVMAYVGEAMCYNEVFYQRQDLAKGRGVLFKIAVKSPERLAKAKTELERDFVKSCEALYGEEANSMVRSENFMKTMAELYARYPTEEEVAAFYALSILTTSFSAKENRELAAKVLIKLNTANPQHPGALSYLIRVYDDPATAYKARKLADEYILVAPDSRNALHTAAHIFLANGDWAKLVQNTEASWNMSEAWVKKNKKSLEDRDYHTLWWLQYGYLQQGKYQKALELLQELHLASRYTKSQKIRFHLAMMRAQYLVISGHWPESITSIEIPPIGFSTSAKNMCFFVDAMAAMEKMDFVREGWFLNQMTDQRMVDKTNNEPFNDFSTCSATPIVRSIGLEEELIFAEVYEWLLEAEKALKTQKVAEAEQFIKKAAELEDKTFYRPGPPVVVKSAHELYGEILIAAGRYKEAVSQFDLALQRAPNRSLSLLGKYTALKKVGESQKAAEIRQILMKSWSNADEQVKLLVP